MIKKHFNNRREYLLHRYLHIMRSTRTWKRYRDGRGNIARLLATGVEERGKSDLSKLLRHVDTRVYSSPPLRATTASYFLVHVFEVRSLLSMMTVYRSAAIAIPFF